MGNKVNLAMQNQFVEFAKKDGEGNDIAEKSAATDAAIAALQEAIAGKVAFDGEYEGTSLKQPDYFDKTFAIWCFNKPAGIYKDKGDIFKIEKYGPGYAWTAILYVHFTNVVGVNVYYGNMMSEPSGDISATSLIDETPTENSGHLITSGGVYSFVKSIYYHPINIWGKADGTHSGDSFSLVIINNSGVAFSSLADMVSWARTNGITSLSPVSGSVHNSDRTKQMIVSWIDIDGSSINVRGQIIGEDQYLQQIAITDANFSDYRFSDNVNRIN